MSCPCQAIHYRGCGLSYSSQLKHIPFDNLETWKRIEYYRCTNIIGIGISISTGIDIDIGIGIDIGSYIYLEPGTIIQKRKQLATDNGIGNSPCTFMFLSSIFNYPRFLLFSAS
ncbi:hypothetical protein PHYBLDRAFT_175388 [Phycomyces blakesleeanus NRRL 1555(-)]|uniref:Uncharacterized protein n=1 Tax=Phycomyces blakesleeanus (strain ATCC 8743b / DSM 1359 / FGSC 10004 / NBRC 33097 / NRRL 1555) TaxID=763407 RepID=A0A167JMS5_PHYB8|nr:hypothetical protein PHYBLDRAFT_175388 [Phycomyces blakesleeanus NRRL 1555(-)]OAD66329.1 hypothetical protein PHYBLDRAFT_175388 [Phycomyces blakesleeanus NRRL 1555(-)]|eukprot:XP_018284369.1 hypothetical protein PHYBLDRAFT_175388 [Phycomyces blakesleeanus NRRL 1555(-)]